MRYLFLLLVISTTNISVAQNQDTTWRKGGNIAFFLQQVALKNWAGGGENSISYGSNITIFVNHITNRHTWENKFEAGYGLIKKEDFKTQKNLDFFIINSNYGNFISEKWQVSAILDVRSQFSEGYLIKTSPVTNEEERILISDFFAPGYIQNSLGLTYRPNNKFNATISPIANRLIFVLNDSLSNIGAFGVDPGEKMEHQIGASLLVNWHQEVMENVLLKTNLLLFGDYSQFNHIDVFWDVFIDMKINKWLTANFSAQMIYDHEVKIEDKDGNIGPRTQLRNILNIGIGYRFGDDNLKK